MLLLTAGAGMEWPPAGAGCCCSMLAMLECELVGVRCPVGSTGALVVFAAATAASKEAGDIALSAAAASIRAAFT